jgi:hypothetical protein
MPVLSIRAVTVEIPFLEELICSYLGYIGVDYHKMLFLSWGFALRSPDLEHPLRIGSRIDFDKGDFLALMDVYCGLGLEKRSGTFDELYDESCEEINNRRAVIATCESMHLPYHRTFGNANASHLHYILLTGYTENEVFVMDPGWLDSSLAIDRTQFSLALKEIRIFKSSGMLKELNLADAINMIDARVMAARQGNLNMFDTIRAFADVLARDFDIRNEVDHIEKYNNESLKWIRLFTSMTRIDGQRIAMSIVFKKFGEMFQETACAAIAELFVQTAKKWALARYSLFKYVLTEKRAALDRAVALLRDASAAEENILREMNALKHRLVDRDSKWVMIALDDHYNANYFGEKGQIDSDSYIVASSVPSGAAINVQGTMFYFPKTTDTHNVIECHGQAIQVPNGYYRAVSIMGFAVTAGYVGDIVVTYADGSEEEIIIALNDFMEPQARFGEKVALNCQIYKYGLLRNGHIFYDCFELDEQKLLSSIYLPNWSKMYVLAISLEKSDVS